MFNKRIYESNPQNADFYGLLFDDDGNLITRRKIYRINDKILFMLSNGFIVQINMNQIQK